MNRRQTLKALILAPFVWLFRKGNSTPLKDVMVFNDEIVSSVIWRDRLIVATKTELWEIFIEEPPRKRLMAYTEMYE